VPTLHRRSNWRICIYTDDHLPPHFHLVGPDFSARVIIDGMRIHEERGQVPRRALRMALAWARRNEELLTRRWNEIHERM
jgi:hypothetical protein